MKQGTATLALLIAALAMLVGAVHKYPCHDGVPREGEPWRSACYSDIVALYGGRGLDRAIVPYLQSVPEEQGDGSVVARNVEYPVLTGALMVAVGLPVNAVVGRGWLDGPFAAVGWGTPDEGLVFFWLTALVLAGLALVTVWATSASHPRRRRDAVMVAAAPMFAFGAMINWDLLAVTLTSLAILSWARRRPGVAGVLLGLAVSAKFYPLVILGPLLLLCVRRRTREALVAGGQTVGFTVLTWMLINLPLALVAFDGWSTFYSFSSQRGADWGSLWFITDNLPLGQSPLGRQFDYVVGHIGLMNMLSWGLLGMCCTGIAALILFAPRRPRLGAMAFLVVAVFLLTNKVWSPQFVLWLIPLAVLARPKWQFFLVWQAVEVGYMISVFQIFLADNPADLSLSLFAIGRWLCVAALCGLVVREALQPAHDVVRRGGVDDPEGGVLVDEDAADEHVPPGESVPEESVPEVPASQPGVSPDPPHRAGVEVAAGAGG